MKKFLSVALAVIMALNCTFLGSSKIVDANWEGNYTYEEWQFEGYDDNDVFFTIPLKSFQDLVNKRDCELVKHNGDTVVVKFPKKDVKKLIEEKPSKVLIAIKAALWTAYTCIALYIGASGYYLINGHLVKPNKKLGEDKTKTAATNATNTTNNVQMTYFDILKNNVKNLTEANNLFLENTVFETMFGKNNVFNIGVNKTKEFFASTWKKIKPNANTDTDTDTSSTNTSNPEQPTQTNVTKLVKSAQTNGTNPVQPIQTNVTKPVKSAQTNGTNPVQPIQTNVTKLVKSAQTNGTNSVQPIQTNVTKPVKSAQTNSTNPVQPIQTNVTKSVQPTQTNVMKPMETPQPKINSSNKVNAEQCVEGFQLKNGKCVEVSTSKINK